MSNFSKASFFLSPSGISAGSIYPQKPLNSNGTLTFTRTGDAWRFNSLGIYDKACSNLIANSEDITSGGGWTTFNVSTTANNILSPLNTLTADRITADTTNNVHAMLYTSFIPANFVHNISVYVKAGTGTKAFIGNSSVGQGVFANLSTGVIEGTIGSYTGQIQNVGNGWYRISLAVVPSSTTNTLAIGLYSTYTGTWSTTVIYTGASEYIYAWGVQVTSGNTLLPFMRTTGSRDSTPRIDFSQGAPCLLLEPQRTNSIKNSTTTGAATGTPGTVPTNWDFTTLPSGLSYSITSLGVENGLSYIDVNISGTPTVTGGSIRFDSSTSTSASNGQTWTSSLYLKTFSISSAIPQLNVAIWERDTSGSFLVSGSTTITGLDSSLRRYSHTRTLSGGVSVTYVQSAIDVTVTSGLYYNFTLRISSPQLELGAYATTYIPTIGSSVTRIIDSFSRSNIYTNGLISASGGTWYVEFKNQTVKVRDNFSLLGIGDTATFDTNSLVFFPSSNARLGIAKYVATVATPISSLSTDAAKVIFKWNGTTADVFINGSKVVSATAFTPTNMNFLGTSGVGTPLYIQTMALFSTPLSDADCIKLTTDAASNFQTAYSAIYTSSESQPSNNSSINTFIF